MSILKEFKYTAPSRLKDVLACLKGGGRLLAGGTLLVNSLKRTDKPPCCVVSLRRVPDLKGVREVNGKIVIGAMTTLADLEGSGLLMQHAPELAAACRTVATTPVRHRATIGGNIACRFFWADLPAVLMALEARVVLSTPRGLRRMGVEDYLARVPGAHVILRVEIPKTSGRAFVRRHTRAMEVDLPVFIVAGRARMNAGAFEALRLVVNSTTSRPIVLKSVEDLLTRTGIFDERAFEAALTRDLAGQKIDAYKLRLLREDVRWFIDECRRP